MVEKKVEAEMIVQNIFPVSKKDINGEARSNISAHSRFLVFFILHNKFGLNYSTIAQLYKMHTSSIIYGIEKAKEYGLTAGVKL